MRGPRRIVCLTTETVDVIYRLGEQDRIVGISGFTVHPPQARREKPKVAAFTTAKIDQILDLEPDLVLGFSDLQADMAAELIRQGVAVYVFNQRDVAGILDMVFQVGALVDASAAARRWSMRYPSTSNRSAKRALNCRAGQGSISRSGTIR